MPVTIKICGLTTADSVETAVTAGADMLGFVAFPPSPRHRPMEELNSLMAPARGRAQLVVLTVEPDDSLLDEIVDRLAPDWIQLHGKETPRRVAEIASRYESGVIKAVGVRTRDDLVVVPDYAAVADMLLFDAKPPPNATRPGGLGQTFDWDLLKGLDPARHYMLSGGLTAANVGSALEVVNPPGVDVSSGIESAPGVKDLDQIRRFVAAVRDAAGERESA